MEILHLPEEVLENMYMITFFSKCDTILNSRFHKSTNLSVNKYLILNFKFLLIIKLSCKEFFFCKLGFCERQFFSIHNIFWKYVGILIRKTSTFTSIRLFFSISFVATGKNVSYTFEYGRNCSFVIVHIWHETLNGQRLELS